MKLHLPIFACLGLMAAVALAQTAPSDPPAQMRSAALQRLPRELPLALPQPHFYPWQPAAPQALRRSLRVPLAAEFVLEPRFALADRGHVERHRPALEQQLSLGLSADPSRPGYPRLDAGPRPDRPRPEPFALVSLPALSRSSDATPAHPQRSGRPPLGAEVKLDPKLAPADRGYVERHRPATEQLALGLSADPPRPEFPLLEAGPPRSGQSPEPLAVLKLPPLSRSSDAPLALAGDPASVAALPFTMPAVAASRGPAPPRTDIAVPDPFVIQREARLPAIPPDADPPAGSFGVPERPLLQVEEAATDQP